jgi:hypothetical protein
MGSIDLLRFSIDNMMDYSICCLQLSRQRQKQKQFVPKILIGFFCVTFSFDLCFVLGCGLIWQVRQA